MVMQPNKEEIDNVIEELQKQGVEPEEIQEITGLGDLIEGALNKFGITEEKFKGWFNLKECNCSKRKAWLNSIFSWRKNNQK